MFLQRDRNENISCVGKKLFLGRGKTQFHSSDVEWTTCLGLFWRIMYIQYTHSVCCLWYFMFYVHVERNELRKKIILSLRSCFFKSSNCIWLKTYNQIMLSYIIIIRSCVDLVLFTFLFTQNGILLYYIRYIIIYSCIFFQYIHLHCKIELKFYIYMKIHKKILLSITYII